MTVATWPSAMEWPAPRRVDPPEWARLIAAVLAGKPIPCQRCGELPAVKARGLSMECPRGCPEYVCFCDDAGEPEVATSEQLTSAWNAYHLSRIEAPQDGAEASR